MSKRAQLSWSNIADRGRLADPLTPAGVLHRVWHVVTCAVCIESGTSLFTQCLEAMKLKPLTVGPIVGETTSSRARIWGRGDTDVIHGQPRRCFGALRYRRQGETAWLAPRIFKMNPNFDMTGVAVLTRLEEESRYEYEMGFFFADVELSDASFRETNDDGTSVWSDASRGHFRTASDDARKPRTIVLGSCRYLLKTFLGDFFDNRGDKTFRTILEQIRAGREVHQLIMVGDQIYADDLRIIAPDRTLEQFYERYRTAFSQEHIRELMSRVPTYMTLDDHEIEDNWPQRASEQDWKTLFPVAIHAYQTYQLSHGPCIPVRGRRLTGTPKELWYDYTDGCCDVFVTDSRTERVLDPGARAMLGATQMRALKRFLSNGAERAKIVVTSVPFFPDSRIGGAEDRWSGFEAQRIELLEYIETREIQRVVFFSGDVHASLSAELVSPSGLKIVSVIASPFFWPYPHPSPRRFQRTGTVDGGRAGTFRVTNASRIVTDDNFARLTIDLHGVDVEIFERKGRQLSTARHDF